MALPLIGAAVSSLGGMSLGNMVGWGLAGMGAMQGVSALPGVAKSSTNAIDMLAGTDILGKRAAMKHRLKSAEKMALLDWLSGDSQDELGLMQENARLKSMGGLLPASMLMDTDGSRAAGLQQLLQREGEALSRMGHRYQESPSLADMIAMIQSRS